MTVRTNDSGKTYVLIHGACHGGWCWSRVADSLRAKGHRVFAPTLSGLAERRREQMLSINLSTHINDVLDLIRVHELTDVILCGHSYGGMVIGGVADRIADHIRHLVFIDAVVPENGRSMADYIFPGEALLGIMDAVGKHGGGLAMPAPPAAFFNVNEGDQAMANRLLTPHPIASLIEKLSIGDAAESIANHSYVFAKNWGFPPIVAQYERARTLPGWQTFEVESGHDIMLDAPERLTDILNGLN